jgi:hypothetical protein
MKMTATRVNELLIRKLAASIRKLRSDSLPDIHDLRSPLHLSLWILAAAREAGWERPLTVNEIRMMLEELEVAISNIQITKALSRAGSKVIRTELGKDCAFKIAFEGRTVLKNLIGQGDIVVLYAEPGKPWKAKKDLKALAESMKGELLVTDRYYGVKTLYTLEILADRKERVRFITAETGENPRKLSGLIHDLVRDKPNLEVRIYPKRYELHDRHILGDDAILLIGHGIKDLGGSESFMVLLPAKLAGDVMSMARSCFEDRWSRSALA